jgi:hypothetical protein
MRKLFVPACVCLVALSGSTGNDPKVSLEPLTSGQTGEATPIYAGKTRPAATSGQATEQAREDAITRNETSSVVATIDVPIAAPSQSDGMQALTRVEPAPLPKPKPEIKPVIYRPRDEVCDILTRAAQHNGLPVPFFIRLLFQESGFSPGVVSNAGAQGIAQFMPNTASEWGVDNPFDPLQAIPASARLLRNLFEKFGNLGLAAAAYNAGPKRIQDWLAKKGSLPQETQGYVKTITGRPAENWKASENGAPAVKLPRHAPCQEAAGLLAWNGPDEIPTPMVAPHRRPAEPVVTAAAAPAKVGDAKNAEAKRDVKITRQGGRVTAAIKVADAKGSPPKANSKGAKTKDSKGALQLAARKQNKKDKKLRVSQR